MLHVPQLVGEDPFDLLAAHQAKEPLRRGDGRVVGVPAGREGVRSLFGNDVDLRHRNAGLLGEIPDDRVELGRVGLGHRLRSVHREDDLVRKPVAPEVHDERHHERDHHSLLAADELAEPEEQGRQGRQKDQCLQLVHRKPPRSPEEEAPNAESLYERRILRDSAVRSRTRKLLILH